MKLKSQSLAAFATPPAQRPAGDSTRFPAAEKPVVIRNGWAGILRGRFLGRPPATEQPEPPQRIMPRMERLLAYAFGAGLVLGAALLTPYARIVWPTVPGFIVSYSTGSLILDLLVAILLVSKGQIEHDGTRVYLAAAFFFAAMIIVPHVASFPDAWVPGIWIGAPGSATWLWTFWHFGFACLIIRYGLTLPGNAAPRLSVTLLTVLLIAGLAAFVGLRETSHLPVILRGQQYFGTTAGEWIVATVFCANLAAAVIVAAGLRRRRGEDLWLAICMLGACVDVWLGMRGGQRFSLGWYCGRICGLSSAFMLFVSLMNDVLQTYKSVALANNLLDRISQTDALTQLGNRRMFDDVLQKEWRRCRRDGLPLSVILFDVDEFKLFNDTYGHQAGDRCLEHIAGRLHDAASRAGDLATRYGGEEFALILPATDRDGGAYVANAVRLTVRDMAIAHAGTARKVITISGGVASLVPSDGLLASDLVRLADLALYQAKASGRDSVVIGG